MRFDKETVRKVAAVAEKFTCGEFAMQGTGSDLGNGVRYFDAKSMRVWFGPEGARFACAYYIGATLGHARATATHIGSEDVHFLKEVQTAYGFGSEPHKAKYREWEEKGYAEAQYRAAN